MTYLAFTLGVFFGAIVALFAIALMAMRELGDDPLPEIEASQIYQD